MSFVSPRPPEWFEYHVMYAEIQTDDPFGAELAVAITEDPSDFDDWFFFYIDEVKKMGIEPEDVVRNPQKYKVVGQAGAWAELRRC